MTPSSHPASHAADALSEQLHALARRVGSPRCYLLMQKREVATTLDERLDLARQAAGIEAIPVRLAPLPESVWPSLLRLDLGRGADAALSARAMEQAWLDVQPKTLREGLGHRACAWIFSDTDPASLARSIASSALLRRPGSRRRKWVRYYDPLVADLYWPLLSSGQRRSMLLGVRAWAYVDRWGDLRDVSVEPAHDTEGASPLNVEQWDRLQHVGALNQAWHRGRREKHTMAQGDLQRSLDALSGLKAYRIRERADVDLFAWHSLRYGSDLHLDVRMQRILREANENEGYAYLVQALTDQDWKDIENNSRRRLCSARRQESGHG